MTAVLRPVTTEDLRSLWVTIPIRIYSRANERKHYQAVARRTKEEKQLVLWTLGSRVRGWFPCTITLVRLGPRRLDGDNLQGGFKGVRDAIAHCIGLDDGDDRLRWVYDQEKAQLYAFRVRFDRGAT